MVSQKLRDENAAIKQKVANVVGSSRPHPSQSTPEKSVADVLRSVQVTRLPGRIKALVPLCETVQRVTEAPTAVKKEFNEDATADDHTLSNTPSTSVGCTLAPEDLEDRRPTTAGIGDCRSKESMPTSAGVGSYAAIAYGKRWYVAEVTDVQDGAFGVSYMTACRGKWKWVSIIQYRPVDKM